MQKEQLESRDYLVAWSRTKYFVSLAPLISTSFPKRQRPSQLVPPLAGQDWKELLQAEASGRIRALLWEVASGSRAMRTQLLSEP